MSFGRRGPLAAILLICFFAGSMMGATRARATGAGATESATTYRAIVEPGAGPSPVISLIRSARHSIKLEVYILSNSSVIQELGKAKRRGVDVRVMLEERPYGAEKYASFAHSLLQQYGVSVRWANESAFTYTHEKAMVVDSKVAGIFSFNLSSSAFYSNREFGVIDRNSSDAQVVAAIFNADWNRRTLHLPARHLVVSPYNSRSVFNHLIADAHRTLDVYAEEVSDRGIENDLIRARNRGVRVRLITSSDSSGVNFLRQSGVGVALMSSPFVHAKAMVADGRNVFIGSENISATSLDNNREVGIALSRSALASVVERTFSADWRNNTSSSPISPPPTPKSGSKLSVRVSASPQSVSRGQELTITGTTSPGAACTIRVTYPDGYVSRAQSLQGSKTANTAGQVYWSWHVGSTVKGTSTAAITCSLYGSVATGSVNFQIT